MHGKIALEEHFALPDTLLDSRAFFPDRCWSELKARLLDIQEGRLREMDAHGIETAILSLNSPAVQALPDGSAANSLAQKANDYLAEQIARQPGRFAGFAALPMQDPAFAIAELDRAVRQLGFKGALVNGFSQVGDARTTTYYDTAPYEPFWAALEELGVPLYLHPRNPLPDAVEAYRDHEWLLGPTWAFGQQTAIHALRLMGCGLFDRHPRLRIILGHLGEGLPYSLWRIDHRNAWVAEAPRHRAARKICDYFNENFYLTTSGNFRTQTLIDAMLEIGADRILFSTDWPFENMDHAARWFDAVPISEADRQKIGRLNARRLFKLDTDAGAK